MLAALMLCILICCQPYYGVMIMGYASAVPVVALATFLAVLANDLGKFSSYFFIVGLAYVGMICAYQ